MRFFRRAYSIPKDVQSREVYYLVDWDFREHKEGRHGAREEILDLLGVGSMREITSTTSVMPLESLELAMKVCEILRRHGAIARVRECRTIRL